MPDLILSSRFSTQEDAFRRRNIIPLPFVREEGARGGGGGKRERAGGEGGGRGEEREGGREGGGVCVSVCLCVCLCVWCGVCVVLILFEVFHSGEFLATVPQAGMSFHFLLSIWINSLEG